MEREVRYFVPDKIESRTDESGANHIEGYAAVFNSDSELLYGEFIERIDPGAFNDTLASGNDVKAFWNHNSDIVLASTRAKTQRLEIRDKGLWFDIAMPNTTWGRDAFESIRRGDVSGVSFGFCCIAHKWEKRGNVDVRTLLKVDLFEVSPCAMPAYPDTTVAVRSLNEIRKSERVNDNDTRRRMLALKERTII